MKPFPMNQVHAESAGVTVALNTATEPATTSTAATSAVNEILNFKISKSHDKSREVNGGQVQFSVKVKLYSKSRENAKYILIC